MDNNAKKIVDFVNYAEKLKVELRHASKSDNQKESVADHSWRLALMAVLIAPHLKKVKIDPLKLLKMAIVHDLVEIESRDVPVLEYIGNEKAKQNKNLAEGQAIEKIREMLGPSGKEICDLWLEYEHMRTDEAKVLKSLDRFEGQLQFLSETVTSFTQKEQKAIDVLIRETTELAKIDPFLENIDRVTIRERKDRIKH